MESRIARLIPLFTWTLITPSCLSSIAANSIQKQTKMFKFFFFQIKRDLHEISKKHTNPNLDLVLFIKQDVDFARKIREFYKKHRRWFDEDFQKQYRQIHPLFSDDRFHRCSFAFFRILDSSFLRISHTWRILPSPFFLFCFTPYMFYWFTFLTSNYCLRYFD